MDVYVDVDAGSDREGGTFSCTFSELKSPQPTSPFYEVRFYCFAHSCFISHTILALCKKIYISILKVQKKIDQELQINCLKVVKTNFKVS